MSSASLYQTLPCCKRPCLALSDLALLQKTLSRFIRPCLALSLGLTQIVRKSAEKSCQGEGQCRRYKMLRQ